MYISLVIYRLVFTVELFLLTLFTKSNDLHRMVCHLEIEFFDETIEAQQEKIAKKFNFQMTDHTMKIIGLCEKCQNK